MKIEFAPTSIHQGSKGSVTGVIYFDFDPTHQFPVFGWNDFVVVLANWWLSALADLMRGADQAQLRFMDGPYWVEVLRTTESSVLLRCVEDRPGNGIVYESTVKIDDLGSCLRKFARDIVTTCAEYNIESTDVSELKRNIGN